MGIDVHLPEIQSQDRSSPISRKEPLRSLNEPLSVSRELLGAHDRGEYPHPHAKGTGCGRDP